VTDKPAGVPVLAGPASFSLQVLKPSGAPIKDAKVEVQWKEVKTTPNTQSAVTDKDGKVSISILDPKDWPPEGTLVNLTVSKDFHGPIVAYGTAFKYGPAKVEFRVKPKGSPQFVILNLPVATQTLWGRPRVLEPAGKPATMQVVLVEGGELGKEHPGVRTRRLSASHRPDAPATAVPQIDEELLFHIAHGGLAPTPASDYKFKVTPPPAGGSGPGTIAFDLPAAPTGSPPNVARISARSSVVGGLRFMHLVDFTGKDKIVTSGEAGMSNLNPRLLVGVIRLARELLTTSADLKAVLTSGFGRAADDAHGNGRAIDFGGLTMTEVPGLADPAFPDHIDFFDPNCTKKTKGKGWETVTLSSGTKVTGHERTCVAEKDFVVFYHWGLVKLLVDTSAGRVRRAEDKKSYRNDFDATSATFERLAYRLSDLPAEADRSKNHKLTDKHYELARDLFSVSYAFFAREFAHHDNLIGPPSTHPALKGPAPKVVALLAQVTAEDAATAAIVPGTVAGFVLHPDYPLPDGGGPKRQSHANHIHANFGSTKPAGGEFER
jgi:hypothetical protein